MPYFDHNATTSLANVARDAWLRAYAEHGHNPAGLTRSAARARLRLESYHEALAVLLGGDPSHYVFTSGATEGAHAVFERWASRLGPSARVAVSATEHACVLAAAARFFPGRVELLKHDADGVVGVAAVREALSAGVAAVAVMASNNETGVLQPWAEIATACREAGVPYLCDATQWLGKLPGAGLGSCGAWVLASGHKFGAPRGVGLVKMPGADPEFRIFPGSGAKIRSGTADVAGAAAFCAALIEAEQRHVVWEWRHAEWRDAFEAGLADAMPGVRVLARDRERLWNTSLVVLPQGENTRWVARLDKRDCQVSTGAACAAAEGEPSHVAVALGLSPLEARRVLRLSAGWETSEADWLSLLAAWREVAAELKGTLSSGG